MDKNTSNLGEFLFIKKSQENLTYSDFAKKLDISQLALWRYTHNLTRPRDKTIIKIAEIIGVEPAELTLLRNETKYPLTNKEINQSKRSVTEGIPSLGKRKRGRPKKQESTAKISTPAKRRRGRPPKVEKTIIKGKRGRKPKTQDLIPISLPRRRGRPPKKAKLEITSLKAKNRLINRIKSKKLTKASITALLGIVKEL